MKDELMFKLKKARAQLVHNDSFFGYLSCMLEIKEEKNMPMPTMATNGKYIFFHPDYVEKITIDELKFSFAHEVLHVALDHLSRVQSRIPELWNIAIDMATNDILVQRGFHMPNYPDLKLCYDEKYRDWSAERIYEDLMKNAKVIKISAAFDNHQSGGQNQDDKDGKGKGNDGKDKQGPAGGGSVPKMDEDAVKKFKDAVIMAASIAKGRGDCPAFAEEMIDSLGKPKIDWRIVLRKFLMTNVARNDYKWNRPNRQYISQGIIMPTLRGEELPPVVIGVDTSGSISSENLKDFMTEIQAFGKLGWDFDAHIFICDAAVHEKYKFKAREIDYRKIKITGRGGTDFRPVFNNVVEDHIKPCCMVFLTDLDGCFPEDRPRYPVLWVATGKDYDQDRVPFGKILELNCD